jgi:hypothetical protein
LRTWLGPLEQVMTHILRNQDLMYKYHWDDQLYAEYV